jgi:hypothetical protein
MAAIALDDPDVPAMVTVAGLDVTAAEELAERVSTWVPATEPAANEAVTPLGSPLDVSATEPVNPPSSVAVTMVVVLPPWETLRVAGEAESIKPGGGEVPLSMANWELDGPYAHQVLHGCGEVPADKVCASGTDVRPPTTHPT